MQVGWKLMTRGKLTNNIGTLSRENLSLGFPTRYDMNQAVQPQRIVSDLGSRGNVLSM